MAEVRADGFTETLEAHSKELAMEAARRWHSAASEKLQRAGDALDYEVFPVVQGLVPPQWSPRENAAEFHAGHPASVFFEHGTTAHEIRSNDGYLAFPWPEMANEEFADTGKTFKEVFSETWPVVFFKEVTVSGIDRIGYMAHGRREAARWLKTQQ